MKMKAFVVATLALMVTACGTRTPVPVAPQPETPDQVQVSEGMLFELDTTTKTIRPIAAQKDGISQQVYYGGTGFTTTQEITDQNDTVYNVKFTLVNTTNQNMGTDSDLTVFVPTFVAQTAANVNVPGGGIVNADGYLPDTFFPYKAFTNQVKPGDGVIFTIAIQVPEGATKAVFSLGVQAGQDYNQIPITANAFMQTAYGKFNTGGFKAGAADQTRFNRPGSLTTCPSGDMYMTDQNGIWRLDSHKTVLLSSREFYIGGHLDCLDDGQLVMSNPTTNQIYTLNTYYLYSPTVISGIQEGGFTDGLLATARYSSPRQIAHHGTDLYVADYNNRAVRKLAKLPDGNYNTTTVVTVPESEGYIEGVTVDPVGNIYFSTTSGIWRKPSNGTVPVKVVFKNAGYHATTLQWHPNGMVLAAEYNENRVRAYTPSSTNINAAWTWVNLAGNGNEATTYSRGEPRKLALKTPVGLTYNKYGTIYFSQSLGYNVLRIDRLK